MLPPEGYWSNNSTGRMGRTRSTTHYAGGRGVYRENGRAIDTARRRSSGEQLLMPNFDPQL